MIKVVSICDEMIMLIYSIKWKVKTEANEIHKGLHPKTTVTSVCSTCHWLWLRETWT